MTTADEQQASRPRLAVVVITRNEEERIGACLKAVLSAVSHIPNATVTVVDSDSSDRTVDIVARYPVRLLRYRAEPLTAAAGRRIGFERVNAEFTLFVDGDCLLEPAWIELALPFMANHPNVAVMYGMRLESHENVADHFESAGPSAEEYSLGGNGLYRTDLLRQVGGFNPFIVSGEEGELLGRILAAGHQVHRTRELMFTHHTVPKDSIQGFLRRRGLWPGSGQVLRLSLGQGTTLYHLRRFNRYLFTLGFLLVGLCLLVAACFSGDLQWLLAWGAVGTSSLALLAWRRRSLRGALTILADWIRVAVALPAGFLRPLPPVEAFEPEVVEISIKNESLGRAL